MGEVGHSNSFIRVNRDKSKCEKKLRYKFVEYDGKGISKNNYFILKLIKVITDELIEKIIILF